MNWRGEYYRRDAEKKIKHLRAPPRLGGENYLLTAETQRDAEKKLKHLCALRASAVKIIC